MDETIEMRFPLAGIDLSGPVSKQPTRKLPDGDYARTTAAGVNVRSFDSDNVMRGSVRPGLAKQFEDAPVDLWIIQELNTIVHTG